MDRKHSFVYCVLYKQTWKQTKIEKFVLLMDFCTFDILGSRSYHAGNSKSLISCGYSLIIVIKTLIK